jgi:hypothetical protein
MGGIFSIMVKAMMIYYVYTLLKKIVLGEDPDLTTVTNLINIDNLGPVNITGE